MRRADLLVAASGLALTLLLAGAHDALDPPAVPLAELPAWDGREVQVEALAVRAMPLAFGGQLLHLADGGGRAEAFLGRPAPPLEGAWLRLRGVPERQRGAWELRAGEVEVLRAAGEPLDARALARLAPALAGAEVAAVGVLRWDAEGPELAASDARVALDLDAPWDARGLAGQQVVVRGTLGYDAAHARFALAAREVRSA
jgi:hypothetical protein